MKQLTSLIILLVSISAISGYEYSVSFTYLDGSSGKLSDYQDTPLLIDTLATWCEPCKIELVHLKEVNDELGDTIEILSISVSPSTDDLEGVRKFKDDVELDQNMKFNWDFALDEDDVMMSTFKIESLPSLYLLDSDGVLVKKWVGITKTADIVAEIDANITVTENSNLDILVNSLLGNPAFIGSIGFIIAMIVYLKVKPKA